MHSSIIIYEIEHFACLAKIRRPGIGVIVVISFVCVDKAGRFKIILEFAYATVFGKITAKFQDVQTSACRIAIPLTILIDFDFLDTLTFSAVTRDRLRSSAEMRFRMSSSVFFFSSAMRSVLLSFSAYKTPRNVSLRRGGYVTLPD